MKNDINVMVVPETEDFQLDVSHEDMVWINKTLGKPNLEGRNAKYIAPYWLTEPGRGVYRIYHIMNIKENETNYEIKLGNSFVVDIWDNMGQYRRFEYHSLENFNMVELSDGLLIPYNFNKK